MSNWWMSQMIIFLFCCEWKQKKWFHNWITWWRGTCDIWSMHQRDKEEHNEKLVYFPFELHKFLEFSIDSTLYFHFFNWLRVIITLHLLILQLIFVHLHWEINTNQFTFTCSHSYNLNYWKGWRGVRRLAGIMTWPCEWRCCVCDGM